MILQLANHCSKALGKETLSLLYPLGSFRYIYNLSKNTVSMSDNLLGSKAQAISVILTKWVRWFHNRCKQYLNASWEILPSPVHESSLRFTVGLTRYAQVFLIYPHSPSDVVWFQDCARISVRLLTALLQYIYTYTWQAAPLMYDITICVCMSVTGFTKRCIVYTRTLDTQTWNFQGL